MVESSYRSDHELLINVLKLVMFIIFLRLSEFENSIVLHDYKYPLNILWDCITQIYCTILNILVNDGSVGKKFLQITKN